MRLRMVCPGRVQFAPNCVCVAPAINWGKAYAAENKFVFQLQDIIFGLALCWVLLNKCSSFEFAILKIVDSICAFILLTCTSNSHFCMYIFYLKI